MSSWSQRRKLTYLSVIVIVVIGVIGVPLFFHFYRAPTCFDGIRNGDEQGIDCGGSCQRLCQNAFLSPDAAWTRLEQVAPGLYNVATYIVNPNSEGEALNVPYQLDIFDENGQIIKETTGTVTIPPHRNTLAFQSAVSTGKNAPVRAMFAFTAPPNWFKSTDSLAMLEIASQKYTEDKNSSSLVVALKNGGMTPLGSIAVSVVLYDQSGNALGFSKTYIDGIGAGATALAPFTWPVSHQGQVISIEVLPVAE